MDIKSKLSEGIVIAAIPVIGYWFSFIYQVGYCKFFDIPTDFIEINIQNIFLCSLGIAGMLGVIISIWSPIHSIYNDIPSAIRRRVRRQVICVMIYMIFSYISKNQHQLLLSATILIPLIFIDFMLPVLTQKTKKTYIEKLESSDELDSKRESLMDSFANKIGFSIYSVIFYTLLLSIFVAYIGAHEAANATQFMISKDKTKVVVKKYGDQFLVAKFNYGDKTFNPEFSLEKIDSSFGVFTYEKIGPLAVKSGE